MRGVRVAALRAVAGHLEILTAGRQRRPRRPQGGLAFERVADLPLPSVRTLWWGNLLSQGDSLLLFGTGPGPCPRVSRDDRTLKPAAETHAIPGVDPAAIRERNQPQPAPSVTPPPSTVPKPPDGKQNPPGARPGG